MDEVPRIYPEFYHKIINDMNICELRYFYCYVRMAGAPNQEMPVIKRELGELGTKLNDLQFKPVFFAEGAHIMRTLALEIMRLRVQIEQIIDTLPKIGYTETDGSTGS
ncbi:unnamed protein product [Caenorhabditis bovis]|uniref:Uncharacterized protein n=1 Tax=Caenorhabditis bovis TaxID=2654633 RepID=A0A8S1FC57_9PELO|nr:unnamed protein product [Caenorhabditis bovis]